MKKISAIILAIVIMAAFTGCVGTASKTPTATDPENPDNIKWGSYEETLTGLCEYLDDLGYMVFDYDASKDEAGTATIKMNAQLIGAESGYKSTYKYGNESWSVEVYYYADTQSEMYKQAESGTFTLTDKLEDGSFKITVRGNFALVINAPEENTQREEDIIKAFNGFYPLRG